MCLTAPSFFCRVPMLLPPSPATRVRPSGDHAKARAGQSSRALRNSRRCDTLHSRTVLTHHTAAVRLGPSSRLKNRRGGSCDPNPKPNKPGHLSSAAVARMSLLVGHGASAQASSVQCPSASSSHDPLSRATSYTSLDTVPTCQTGHTRGSGLWLWSSLPTHSHTLSQAWI